MRNSRLYFLNCWFSQFTLKLREKKTTTKRKTTKTTTTTTKKNTHTKRPQDSHSQDMYYLKYGTFRAKNYRK